MGSFIPAAFGATDARQWSSYSGTPNKIIYVAASPVGNDGNDGLTVNTPVATLAHAQVLAGIVSGGAGVEAWILLRQGDTWTGETFGADISRSGIGPTQPIIYSCYDPAFPGVFNPGTGPRPIIQTTVSQQGFAIAGNWGDNVALIGFEFYSYQRDPGNTAHYIPGTNGSVCIVGDGIITWWWIEDVKATFYGGDILDFSQQAISNVTIYRCVFANAYQATNFASGMHAIWRNSSIIETLWDNNGWNASEAGSLGGNQIFSHNIYLQAENPTWRPNFATGPTIISGCFFSNDASGADIRTGGTITNNTFVHNPFPFGNYATSSFANIIDNNVFLEAVDYPGTSTASFSGVDISSIYQGIDGSLGTFAITNNIFSNSIATSGFGLTLDSGVNGATVNNNIFYNWPTQGGQMVVNFTGAARTFGSLVGGSGYTPGALFTGSIDMTTKVLTVTAISSGTLLKGQVITGDTAHSIPLGIANGAVITGQLTGSAGSTGTYSTDYIGLGSSVASTFLSTTTYYLVPLTTLSGGGSGAVADITVNPSGVVTNCVISLGTVFETSIARNDQSGYTAGVSVLSATPSAPFYNSLSDFGGFSNSTGSGFSVTVASVATNTIGSNVIDAAGANNLGAPEPFPDPTRSVGSYYATLGLGGGGTLTNFLAAARLQSRHNWDSRLTANAVNSYIRAGFGISTGPSPDANITEAASLTDIVSGSVAFRPTFAESYALSETPAAQKKVTTSFSETYSISDTVQVGANSNAVSIAEHMAFTDLAIGGTADIHEVMSLADLGSNNASYNVTIAETSALADHADAEVSFHGIWNVSIAESVALVEAAGASAIILPLAFVEAMTFADSLSGSVTGSPFAFNVSIIEAMAWLEAVSASPSAPTVSDSEAIVLAESLSSYAAFHDHIEEVMEFDDDPERLTIGNPIIIEGMSLVDLVSATTTSRPFHRYRQRLGKTIRIPNRNF